MSFCDVAIPSVGGQCRWLAFLVLLQSLLWTTVGGAQSPASVIKEFGLLGTWADDCSARPGQANQYTIFSLTSRGNIELRSDFGPDYDQMVYRIVDAQRLSHFRLALRQLLTSDDQIVLNVVVMKASDRIRIWSSAGPDGSIFVEDGTIPSANGRETGWMVRCDVRWTGNSTERFRKLDGLVGETFVTRQEHSLSRRSAIQRNGWRPAMLRPARRPDVTMPANGIAPFLDRSLAAHPVAAMDVLNHA
jgi:hypothetical protein